MPSMESLVALIAKSVNSPEVQAVIASEELVLSSEEDLEEGEPVRSFLSSPSGEYLFSHTLDRIDTLFIYIKPKTKHTAFTGELIRRLTINSSRMDVRRIFGMPTRSGEPQDLPPLGRFGGYDRYDSKELCLHFQYSESDEQIEMITIMSADIAP